MAILDEDELQQGARSRELKLYMDNILLADGAHVHVTGKSSMTMYPDAWQIDVYDME